MINTVIFDIGRVLIGFEWRPYLNELFRGHYPEPVALQEKVTAASFKSGRWNEMDRGILSGEEIMQQCIDAAPELAEPIRMAFENVGQCTERMDYAIPWIEELKARGYRVLFLSNYSEYVQARSRHALDFLTHLEGGVFSCDVHSVKPEQKIYDEIVTRYDLQREHCVFIDDNAKNIQKADEMGFRTVLFENYEQAHRELEDLLQREA